MASTDETLPVTSSQTLIGTHLHSCLAPRNIADIFRMRKVSSTWQLGLSTIALVLLVLATDHAASIPVEEGGVKRQWLFHCGGWGPGCMKLTAKTVPMLRHPVYRQALSQVDPKITPTFMFTSGSSWGAIGKRHSHSEQEKFRQLLMYALLSKTGFMYKDLLYRGMLRHYMQQRMRAQMVPDVPQIS